MVSKTTFWQESPAAAWINCTHPAAAAAWLNALRHHGLASLSATWKPILRARCTPNICPIWSSPCSSPAWAGGVIICPRIPPTSTSAPRIPLTSSTSPCSSTRVTEKPSLKANPEQAKTPLGSASCDANAQAVAPARWAAAAWPHRQGWLAGYCSAQQAAVLLCANSHPESSAVHANSRRSKV